MIHCNRTDCTENIPSSHVDPVGSESPALHCCSRTNACDVLSNSRLPEQETRYKRIRWTSCTAETETQCINSTQMYSCFYTTFDQTSVFDPW